MALRYETI